MNEENYMTTLEWTLVRHSLISSYVHFKLLSQFNINSIPAKKQDGPLKMKLVTRVDINSKNVSIQSCSSMAT